MIGADADDAIQDLARIAQAATRLMAQLHRFPRGGDLYEEVPHMQANLDHVRKALPHE